MVDRRVAVLNYHRVVPDGTESHFYDMPESVFRIQMEVLSERMVGEADGQIELSPGVAVYLTFDDGTEDHYRMGHLLHEMGLPAVLFVVTGKLDVPGRLTTDQVIELVGMGHRIGSHTVTHPRLPEIGDADLHAELADSRRQLEDLIAHRVDWLAPPGGHYDERVLRAATDAGYRVVRTMEWGYASHPIDGRIPALPVLPSYGREGFIRLIDGRARLWPYRLKQVVKNAIGEDRYVKLRDTGIGYLRKRGPGSGRS